MSIKQIFIVFALCISGAGAAHYFSFSQINLFDEAITRPVQGGNPSPGLYRVRGSADFDQDGYDDLVVAYSGLGTGQFAVMLNQSGTGFIEVWVSPVSSPSEPGITIGDFNGDGWLDLLELTGGEDDATIWINQIPNNPICASDLDKTGNVDFSDLLFVLNEWGECGQQIN